MGINMSSVHTGNIYTADRATVCVCWDPALIPSGLAQPLLPRSEAAITFQPNQRRQKLIIVKKALVRLVHSGSGHERSSIGRTGVSKARVREVKTLLLYDQAWPLLVPLLPCHTAHTGTLFLAGQIRVYNSVDVLGLCGLDDDRRSALAAAETYIVLSATVIDSDIAI
jgi:hypothetical protein